MFDFDGLIFDSETHEYECVRELFAEHGAELPLDVWGACVGREAGYFDPYAYLEEHAGVTLDREAADRRRIGSRVGIRGNGGFWQFLRSLVSFV